MSCTTEHYIEHGCGHRRPRDVLQAYAHDLYRAARIMFWHHQGDSYKLSLARLMQREAAAMSLWDRQVRGVEPSPRLQWIVDTASMVIRDVKALAGGEP